MTETPQDPTYFRNLVASETERLSGLCDSWEGKLRDTLPEDVQGSIRSVTGQGRLVMAERFSQFLGLVDNCELKRGEKETTTMDLLGFWEMIFFQVSDVDKKFSKLSISELNNWREESKSSIEESKAKIIESKRGVKKPVKSFAQRPNSNLKAMIAAKRAALHQKTTPEKSEARVESPDKVAEERHFDGGFFEISSPGGMTMSKSTGGGRKKVVERKDLDKNVNSAKCDRTQRSSLLSPYVSNMAKRIVAGISPRKEARGTLLFDTTEETDVGKGVPEVSRTYSLRPTPGRVNRVVPRVFTPSAN